MCAHDSRDIAIKVVVRYGKMCDSLDRAEVLIGCIELDVMNHPLDPTRRISKLNVLNWYVWGATMCPVIFIGNFIFLTDFTALERGESGDRNWYQINAIQRLVCCEIRHHEAVTWALANCFMATSDKTMTEYHQGEAWTITAEKREWTFYFLQLINLIKCEWVHFLYARQRQQHHYLILNSKLLSFCHVRADHGRLQRDNIVFQRQFSDLSSSSLSTRSRNDLLRLGLREGADEAA